MSLTIARRLSLLVAIAFVISMVIITMQIMTLHDTLYQERQNALKQHVQSTISIIKYFADEADQGKMPLAQAQEGAKQVIRKIRYGHDDYFFGYTYDGTTVLHAKKELEGRNRYDEKEPKCGYTALE